MYRGQFREPVVLVLGKTGTGKSSICNAMAGLPPDTEDGDEGFCTSIETYSCTENTTVKECCFFGDPTRPIKIIDTPGFDDPRKNHDTEDGDEGFCTSIETYSCTENTSERKIPMPLFLLTC